MIEWLLTLQSQTLSNYFSTFESGHILTITTWMYVVTLSSTSKVPNIQMVIITIN
jgi:hypothetical protein